MLGLSGLFAPLVTPFTDDGEAVSEVRLARLVRYLASAGVSGFVCCTDTGEFITVNTAERKALLEMLMREAQGMPVLAHCTRLGTMQCLDLCQHAARHGARAAVVMPPYFGSYSDEEVEQHLRRIAQHAGLPIIVVDPQHLVRSGMKERLCTMPDIVFAESPERAFRTRLAVDPVGAASDEFVIEDAIVSPLVQVDAASAVNPDSDLTDLAGLIFRHSRPRVAKAALNLREIEVGPPRAPVLPLAQEAVRELASLIQIA